MTAGRPTSFTPELAQMICNLIAEGHSLNMICKNVDGMPTMATVLRWVFAGEAETSEDLNNFYTSYTLAMKIRSEVLASQTIDIADHKGNDFKLDANGVQIFDDRGNPVIDHDNVQRAKLQIDTRLKYIAFVQPKKYGVKMVEQKTESTNTNLNLNVDYELTVQDDDMLRRLRDGE